MGHLSKSFDAFFSSEAKVAVLKGSWGVGKTYFWDDYIAKRIDQKLPQIAYSYISLFGKTTLNDVKKSIFHSARAITSDSVIQDSFDKEFKKSSKLLDKVPWAKSTINNAYKKTPWLNWLTRSVQLMPVVNKFSGAISSLEYGLVNNYVICFDDLERKGSNLSVREIMGLIDELVLRKNCKVILIFNEDSLENENDREEFESYREKVVDIELLHNPSCIDNLNLVFPPDYEQISILTDVVNELDIKNIRVLKKIKWLIENVKHCFDNKSEEILQEFLTHASILAWGYYVRDKVLSYELLKEQLNRSSWMSLFGGKDEEKSPSMIRYRSMATNLKLSVSDFDKHIIYYLEHGYIDESGLSEIIDNLSKNIEVNQASTRLREAWDIYSGSFKDNLNDFITAIKSVIDNDIDKLGVYDFSSAINILEEFNEDVSRYIKNYITIHESTLKNIDSRGSWDMSRIKPKALKNAIKKLNKENKNFNIDEVAKQIADKGGWSQEYIDFLASLTKGNYYDWMKSNPNDLTHKIRNGLLIFEKMQPSCESDKPKYNKISTNIINALKQIASENEFNRKRIKYIYGIE